jgi:hypothetical protein
MIKRRLIIGDVHGHLEALIALLAAAGIKNWHVPPDTEIIFLGDLIDRGPDSAAVVANVRALCERGRARCLLGNHEFNFINYHTETGDGGFRRPHTPTKTAEVKETLDSYEEYAAAEGDSRLRSDIEWMMSLPIALEIDGLRAVHACWHPEHLCTFDQRGDGWYLRKEHWNTAWIKGTSTFESVEVLCKGLEDRLPCGVTFVDKGGVERDSARISWWNREPNRWEDYIRAPGIDFSQLHTPLDVGLQPLAPTQATVFGHYWFTGEPALINEHTACLDYSVASARNGRLCAYEHRAGEVSLRGDRLRWVDRIYS